MRKFLVLIVSVLMTTFVSAEDVKVDRVDPYKMIKEVADITFKRVASEQQAIKQNPNVLKEIVREELIPYVNYRYAGAKILGRYYKKTKKEDRETFFIAFRDYLITSYAQVFTLYQQQKVEFAPEMSFAKKKIVLVKTLVLQPGGEPINITFKVRKNSKTSKWKAYDMVAEGVSLLDSKQAELASVIRQKGVPYVTELLKEKSKQNIVFKGK